jgi:formylmethanofuran dehydrogenase subunit E
MTEGSDLFLQIGARHGHYCAMSTLGGRLGTAALAALGVEAEELTATYFIDTCAADGIAVATGCVPAVKAEGRHRLELRSADGRGVAAELTAAALERAAACRKQLDAGEDTDAVLAALRAGPADELITLTPLAGEGNDA